MIKVRQAEPDDGRVLGEIHAAAWEAAYAPFFAPDFAARGVLSRRTRWHDRVAGGTGTILLAALDDRPVALSLCLPSPGRPGLAEICSFYSHPDAWGSGVAAVLMTGTLNRLRDEGFTRVHLWTLRDTPQSRRFYAKSGFAETGAARAFDFGEGNLLDQIEYERAC
ncbi:MULTISPECIES: GNAT family N-acetyltransferase [unclassified Streptomyces]|uniref:GNAT family N-acetyltransferase n=1 Tax=unclassified Streptomyces TaxID=2593676 RepID=UPI0028C50EA0|nr:MULTISPECIES: GNAT family N-acetyltransferase [unclassified Streptomyces]WNO71280.1 GNAT family N-acetyltransferase [Streptomyces sp. AM8-1-1]